MDKIKILIVDDTPENIQAAASILGKQGYQIAFDQGGENVLTHTKSMQFDLILLDIIMPGINGYEVCRLLKSNPETDQIPVIFLTAKNDRESIVQGFEVGAADYVTKPFCEVELLARVKTHLKLRQQQRRLEKTVQDRTSALEIVLQIQEKMSIKYEEKILANIENRIFPLIATLRETLSNPRQQECLKSITAGLRQLLSNFSHKLATSGFDLTATEIQVAGFIREGKSSKQIADLLCLSENTVVFHRQNIRKKLGLTGQGKNLRCVLKAMG